MKHAMKTLLASGVMLATTFAATAQEAARVVVVNHPLEFVAQTLLGDAGNVSFSVPADVDPSFWRPAIADISAFQAADLILLNGAGFATWVDRVSLPRSKVVNTTAGIEDRFITTESITHSHGDGGEHSHEGLASYTWLDPSLFIAQAEAVASAITARALAPEADVDARLSSLRDTLSELDAQAEAALAGLVGVPMIATHPRYQYFARRYDLSIASLEWEAGEMPDDAALADLAALIDTTGARILIWEAAPPPAAFEATSALGVKNVVFAPLAHGVEGQSYPQAYMAAVTALAEAGTE